MRKIEVWEKFLITLGVVFYLLLFPHGIHGDASFRFDSLRHLLDTGKFQPVVYSLVGPLVSSPLLLLGKFVKDQFWWMSRFNTFVFLLSVFYFVRLIASTWTPERRRVLILLLFCATMFPKHVTDYYSEVFSACLGALAFILWARGRFALGALLLCLSVWNTPGTLLGGAFAAAYFAFRERKLRYFFALGLLPAGILLETYLKFGHFFPKDYMGHVGVKGALPYSGLPGFSYPLFFGVLSVLFSYGKGLLFFTPGLLGLFRAEIWRERERDFLISGTLYTIGLILVFSRWWAWSGDWFWGPRFYLFASLLGAFVLAISYGKAETLPWRLFWFGAAALSLWVGCQGILFGQDFLEDCISGNEVLGSVCNYVPEYSVLWRFFVVLPPLHGRKIAYMAYFVLVAITVLWRPGRELVRDLASRALTFVRGLRETRWSF